MTETGFAIDDGGTARSTAACLMIEAHEVRRARMPIVSAAVAVLAAGRHGCRAHGADAMWLSSMC